MELIGIAGKAGSGKDIVADYLVQHYGYTKISFATALKSMLAVVGIHEPVNRDDKEKVIEGMGFSYRHAAQTLGTEYGRKCLGEDIWVTLTMHSLKKNGKYVISDVRFSNEADVVRKHGKLLHMKGREVDLGILSAHASEAGVAFVDGDGVLDNNGTLYSLYMQIDELWGDAK